MKSLWLVTLYALLTPHGNAPIDRPTQLSVSQVSEYDLSIKVFPDLHRLEVTGTWRLPPAPAARNEIEFYLSPKMEGLVVQLLEPKASAPLNLQSSKEEGGELIGG